MQLLLRSQILVLILSLCASTSLATGIADDPTISDDQPKNGFVDLRHIERNAAYTVLVLGYAPHSSTILFGSWDTDEDGAIGGTYTHGLMEDLNLTFGTTYNSKKAGNHSFQYLLNLVHSFGPLNLGGGIGLELGTDTRASRTIGRQNTLTYRFITGYDLPVITFQVVGEKYRYRNPTYRVINARVPNHSTSSNGISSLTIESNYIGFKRFVPYVVVKLKEHEGPIDDTEVRMGIRTTF
jgi:hypothetical protein